MPSDDTHGFSLCIVPFVVRAEGERDWPGLCCWIVSVRSCRCSRRSSPPMLNSSRNQKEQGSLMTMMTERTSLLPPQPTSTHLQSCSSMACKPRPWVWNLGVGNKALIHQEYSKTLNSAWQFSFSRNMLEWIKHTWKNSGITLTGYNYNVLLFNSCLNA